VEKLQDDIRPLGASVEHLAVQWHVWLLALLIVLAALLGAWLAHRLTFLMLRRVLGHAHETFDGRLTRYLRRPLALILPVIALLIVLPALPFPPGAASWVARLLGLALTAGIGWLAVAGVDILADLVLERSRAEASSGLAGRRLRTQSQVFRRIAIGIVIVVTAGIMLMSFPGVRHVGVSLFASAGVAGLIAGLAARPTISNLIAGAQIALAQPIRVDDVVIVEGEWGWIEEITMTYVVVRIWDLRRLVLPLSYFIEQPFQNWTHTSEELLGTVFVYADYTVSADALRQELKHILDGDELWDGKAWALEVTDASEHTLQLRALVSASDSGRLWDLRCHVRERLIGFLQQRQPEALPQARLRLPEPLRGEGGSPREPMTQRR
jgi:small-conductance mechanosensitive channel